MTLSVVIPTYRGRNRLAATVLPLLADPALHEAVVVVDGSDDGSIELLEEWAADDPRLRPVLIPNSGDNEARQVGLERATGDVVLFMDDDVVAHPGLLQGHLAHHQQPGRVVLGYMPVAPEQPPRPDDFPRRLYARWYEEQTVRYEEHPDRILHNLWQGNVSLPREDALRIGIPRPEYDARYGPDRELGLRFAAGGLTGVFDRSLRAEHRYVRAPDAFFADARSAGEAMWLCHHLHADVLGPLTPCAFRGRPAGPDAVGHPARTASPVRRGSRPCTRRGDRRRRQSATLEPPGEPGRPARSCPPTDRRAGSPSPVLTNRNSATPPFGVQQGSRRRFFASARPRGPRCCASCPVQSSSSLRFP